MASPEGLNDPEIAKESSVNGLLDQHFDSHLKSVFDAKKNVANEESDATSNEPSKSNYHETVNGAVNDINDEIKKPLTSDITENTEEEDRILIDDINETNTEEVKIFVDGAVKEIKLDEITVVDELSVETERLGSKDEFKMASDEKELDSGESESDVRHEIGKQPAVIDKVTLNCDKNGTKKTSSETRRAEISETKPPSVSLSSTRTLPMLRSSSVARKPDLRHHGRTDPVVKNVCAVVNHRPVAKLLINMGLELVREKVIKTLIEIQTEKEKNQQLDETAKSQLEKLEDSLKNLVVKNEAYKVPVRRCKCTYVAFTDMALELHRQFGGSMKLRQYRCCICMKYKTRNPPKFISHMGKEHKILARFLSIPPMQCPFCPFEHRQLTLLDRHIVACHKKFSLSRNLVITQNIFDIPVYEALQKPKAMSTPNQMVQNSYAGFPRVGGISGVTGMGDMANAIRATTPIAGSSPFAGLSVADILSACNLSPQIQAQVLSNLSLQSAAIGRGQKFPGPGFSPLGPLRSPGLPQSNPPVPNWLQFGDGNLSAIRNSMIRQRLNLPLSGSLSAIKNSASNPKQNLPLPTVGSAGRGNFSQQRKHMEQLHRGGTPAEKNAMPAQRAGAAPTRSDISPMSLKCEICDLPSRDLESLRLHLVALHREPLDRDDFHRKGRTLNCSSCSERFWTKQGALRHFVVRHGPSEPPAYQCIRCGAMVATSILNHLSSQHNVTVLDMYEAKFCMLCNASFKTANQFENHVVEAHADIFPNRLVLLTMIKALTAAYLYKTMSKPDMKPMRPLMQGMGPRPGLPRGAETLTLSMERPIKMRPKGRFSCHDCCINFASVEELEEHCNRDHTITCSRCTERWNSIELMQRHFQTKHHNEKDSCILCGELVQIGRPTVRHIKRMHLRDCSVVVKRMRPKDAMRYLTKRRRLTDGRPGNSTVPGGKSDGLFGAKVEEVMEVGGERIVIEKNG